MKILIIEDDPGIIEDLAATLTVSDYQIIKVNNGYEALKIIRSLNKRSEFVEIMVTPLEMPEMKGLKLFRLSRELIPELCVIFTTDSSDFHILEKLEKLSCCWYIDKPYTPKDLIETIRKIGWRLKNPYYEIGF